MTQDDQDASIGRLVQQYSAAKQRRVAVIGELNRIATVLDGALASIRSTAREAAPAQLSPPPAAFPTREALAQLYAEYNETTATIAECRRLLTEAGLKIE